MIARENCPLADSFGLPFSAAVIDRYITLRDVLYVLHVFFLLMSFFHSHEGGQTLWKTDRFPTALGLKSRPCSVVSSALSSWAYGYRDGIQSSTRIFGFGEAYAAFLFSVASSTLWRAGQHAIHFKLALINLGNNPSTDGKVCAFKTEKLPTRWKQLARWPFD